ncbi:MAG TPA: family 43 glycosylhydrolase [Microlunatus sp.]
MMFSDSSSGVPFAKDPAVVRFGDRYLLYYSRPPLTGSDGWSIGIAESTDLDEWTIIGEIPISQHCERNGICAPGAIVLDGRVHVFYQTYGNGADDAICHAVSDDGTTFTKDPSNPVVSPTGDWNNGRAIDADLLAWDGRLFLYFATRDPRGVEQLQGVATAPLTSDFGRDAWTQACQAPILAPELDWERQCIEAAATCEHDGRLYLFYAGGYNNEPQQIGCAISDDGISWTRLFDRPFLSNGEPGSWNSSESGHPYVFVDDDGDGRTHLFFQGNNDDGRTWYLSRVEVGWEDGLPRLVEVEPAER